VHCLESRAVLSVWGLGESSPLHVEQKPKEATTYVCRYGALNQPTGKVLAVPQGGSDLGLPGSARGVGEAFSLLAGGRGSW
jgi:hypothetical protein